MQPVRPIGSIGEEPEMGRVVVVSTRQLIRNLIGIGRQSVNGYFQQILEISSDQETVLQAFARNHGFDVLSTNISLKTAIHPAGLVGRPADRR